MRRAIALVTAVLLLPGCGLAARTEPVMRTIDYSLKLTGDAGLFGLQFRHTTSNGDPLTQSIIEPAWTAQITIEAGPARMVELAGQGEPRSYVKSEVARATLPMATCTIHIDGRKAAEHTGKGVLCQAMVDQ